MHAHALKILDTDGAKGSAELAGVLRDRHEAGMKSYMRIALYRVAFTGLQGNPVLRAHYQRKRAQGKSKMNA